MIDGINNLKGVGTESINIEKQKQETKKLDFSDMLKQAVEEVNTLQKNADKVVADYASGITDISQVVISAEKASLSLKLTVEVTNRIVEAYKEIMRMQI